MFLQKSMRFGFGRESIDRLLSIVRYLGVVSSLAFQFMFNTGDFNAVGFLKKIYFVSKLPEGTELPILNRRPKLYAYRINDFFLDEAVGRDGIKFNEAVFYKGFYIK